jgi:type IV pilus assembly protein PilP
MKLHDICSGRMMRAASLSLLAVLLTACESGHQDLQTWMDQTRQATPTVVEKVAEPKQFEPFRYRTVGEVDPFNQGKLKVLMAAAAAAPASTGSGLVPDLKRRREALEAFPLDALQMVGNLRLGGSHVALLKVDSQLHQVRVGNHIGQNFGRVLKITESGVAIREIVQDAAGDWVERVTELRLQESGK